LSIINIGQKLTRITNLLC